ncbi:MAG TPA: alpha/beta hydrolase [Micromonosporaceae bacterium]|jgi:pimeloyl-ACP methyl ester carboxylesterase
MSVQYVRQSVPTDGGELAVGVWGETGPLVVAAHGLTSAHMEFVLVGERLGEDHRFVAPDLRGRGHSRELPGPYGMARHAADLAAVVEAYGGGPATLVGHSMGGWVVLETARQYPLLADRLVLVDGGAPLPVPPGVDGSAGDAAIAMAIEQALGPAFARLSMTFPSAKAYRELWRAHPSFSDWSDAMDAYADYDLVGDEPELRPACLLAAALRDAREMYAFPGVEPQAPPAPAVFLRAERGMLDEPAGFYEREYASAWLPGVSERTVPDVNHYTITLSGRGADAVAAAVRSAQVGLDREGMADSAPDA